MEKMDTQKMIMHFVHDSIMLLKEIKTFFYLNELYM